jgi:two-component system nitrate/nitrite response regulator NarL
MHALVVDDDDFVRFLLVRTLGDLGFSTIDDASTAADGLHLASVRRPELAVLDLDLGPGPTGIDLAYGLRKAHPAIGVIILSSYADPRLLGANRDMPDGGIYLSKRDVGHVDVLKRAVTEALDAPRGRRTGAPEVIIRGRRLSDNQVEIMRLIAEGLSNAEIARRRHLTDAAVEKAITRLIKQLDLSPTRDQNARILITQAYFALIGATQVRRD